MLVLLDRGDVVEARRVSVLHRVAARLGSHRLAQDLASGAAPDGAVLHSLQAQRLVDPRHRRRLARALLARAREASHEAAHAGSRSAHARVVVHEAAVEVRALADTLLRSAPMSPRGVAMAHLLVTDGLGPLHRGRDPWDLRLACRAAIDVLETAIA